MIRTYVTANPHVQGGLNWEGVKWAFCNTEQAAYWAPLMWLSHMLACQFFGLNAWGHHLINVLLHAANTALVFLVFQRMTGATWRSLILAALFGWHPLRVESVAWVTERKDVLSTLLRTADASVLRALCAEMQKPEAGSRNPNSQPLHRIRFSLYWLALFFFALGLMSKPMLVTMPFVHAAAGLLAAATSDGSTPRQRGRHFAIGDGENPVLCPGGGGERRDLRGAEAGAL